MSQIDETTRKELKIQALRERVAQVTAEAEDRVADLRVELTIVSQQLQEAQARVAELEAEGSDEVPTEEPAKSTN